MVRITNGRNVLIVPTSSYNELYAPNGWSILAKKKTDSIIKRETEDNSENEIAERQSNKRKK